MAIPNPISITYGSRSIGGTSGQYQIVGPYILDKNYESIRVVVDVVVVAEDVATLQPLCDNLEVDFRKRLTDGDTLVITACTQATYMDRDSTAAILGLPPERVRIAHWMVARTLRDLGRTAEALAIQQRLERENAKAGTPDPFVFEELAHLHRTAGDAARAAHYDALARR